MDLSQYLETMKNLPERFSNLNFWRGVRKLRDKMVDTFEYVGEWGNGIDGDIASLKGDLDDLSSSKIAKFYASNLGENHITDSDNGKIQDIMIYGKSLQDGTPTPDNPIEIQSVVNPKLSVSNTDNTLTQEARLPYTLNAIPVSSGGNVTIDGQQYIADYVDIESKNLHRLLKKINVLDLQLQDDGIFREFHDFIAKIEKYDSNNYIYRKIPIASNKFIEGRSDISEANKISYKTINDAGWSGYSRLLFRVPGEINTLDLFNHYVGDDCYVIYQLKEPTIINLTDKEVEAFKALNTYYPTTNIIVNSEQLDGYTIFTYPISMQNGWNYVKQQLNDNRDYIYDMDTQSAEAYVNSEYAVELIELEV